MNESDINKSEKKITLLYPFGKEGVLSLKV